MTPRVLWTIRGLGPGGAENLLTAYARSGSTAFDYDVAYTLPHKSHLADELREMGIGVHSLPSPWPVSLARLVRSGRYAIVHNHAPVPAAVTRVAARTMRPSRRPRVVTTEHGLWSRLKIPTQIADALTVPADDDRLAVSVAVRDSLPAPLRRGVEVLVHGLDRRSVLAAAAERDQVRAELGVSEDDVLVGTVANYRAVKGWPDLLSAADRVVRSGAPVRFIGIGQGPLADEVEAQHAAYDFGDRFRLLGYQPDAVRYVAAMDIFCMASLREGLPVALMEALVLGRPVVATAVGGIPEAVQPGVEGLLVPASDPNALADAITSLARDPARRAAMGAAASAAGARFEIGDAITAIEHRYRRLLEG